METENQITSTAPIENRDVIRMDMDEAKATAFKASWWFIGVAFLSFVNSLIIAENQYYPLGLGLTQFIDGVVIAAAGSANPYISLIIPTIFVILAMLGMRMNRVAFITGAVVYLLDTGLYLVSAEWLAVGFHLLVLYNLFRGYKALREYHALKKKYVII